jgi:hypothetical protein
MNNPFVKDDFLESTASINKLLLNVNGKKTLVLDILTSKALIRVIKENFSLNNIKYGDSKKEQNILPLCRY